MKKIKQVDHPFQVRIGTRIWTCTTRLEHAHAEAEKQAKKKRGQQVDVYERGTLICSVVC